MEYRSQSYDPIKAKRIFNELSDYLQKNGVVKEKFEDNLIVPYTSVIIYSLNGVAVTLIEKHKEEITFIKVIVFSAETEIFTEVKKNIEDIINEVFQEDN